MSDDGFSRKGGYRKPPKEHQFKKGQSGNPRGRPKKDFQDIREVFKKLFGAYYKGSENGKWVRKTGLEALGGKLMQMGLAGDLRSIKYLLDCNREIFFERAEFEAHVEWLRILREQHGIGNDKPIPDPPESEAKN